MRLLPLGRRRGGWWLLPCFLLAVVGCGAAVNNAGSAGHAPVAGSPPPPVAEATSPPPLPPGVIGWADLPAPAEPAAAYPSPPHAPACQPAQLRMAAAFGGAGAGDTTFGRVTATNVGTSPCSLVGTPRAASILTAAGRWLPVTLGATRQLSREADTDLRPGDQAMLDVIYADGAQDGCTSARPRTLRLTLPAGGTVTITSPPFPAGNCPHLEVDAFSVPRAAEPIPLPIDSLQISLQVPKTVRAGTVLAYTVTLTNPTTEPIRLTPCPGYWAHGFYQGESVVHDQLNCDGHSAIVSGASLTFAMRIPVPARADPGAPLYWHLDTPAYQDGGTSPQFREASAGIVVTARSTADGTPSSG